MQHECKTKVDALEQSTGEGVSPLITYSRLTAMGREMLTLQGLGGQQIANLVSALNVWRKVHSLSSGSPVLAHFAGDFEEMFLRFQDVFAENAALRTQKDRAEQILRWREIHNRLRQEDTLPLDFSEALRLSVEASPLTKAHIARSIGVAMPTLNYWIKGERFPISTTEPVIRSLEKLLELPEGSLVKRLPIPRRIRYSRQTKAALKLSVYSKRLMAYRAAGKIGGMGIPITLKIRAQWTALIRFKSDLTRPTAVARNTWRVKLLENVGHRVHPMMIADDHVCATAGAHWGFLGGYLGRLGLDAPDGYGIPVDVADTLAWLAIPEYIEAHSRWMVRRAGGILHHGVLTFLSHVRSHLRAKTGFLSLHPEIANTLPADVRARLLAPYACTDEDEAWRRHCEVAYKRLIAFTTSLETRMRVTHSRNPKEPIEAILRDEFPLLHLVAFVERLEQSVPPLSHQRDYRSWLRDMLFVRMLISNPLRVSMFSLMEFRADNSGHVVRTGGGHWALEFAPSDFKNEKGAAGQAYSARIDDSVVPWLERYLAEARPYLVGADETDRLFLPTVLGPRRPRLHIEPLGRERECGWTAEGISRRFKELTTIYVPECMGFAPHAVRHIIATDHLKRHPSDYVTVAKLLHDTLATVLKEYAHLSADDGLRVLSTGLRDASVELERRRGH